jgi:hypothetical protein
VESVAVYTPGYTDTASVDTSGTTVTLASVEVLGYSQFSIYAKNTGATNNIDYCYLYSSPNGSDWFALESQLTDIAPGGTQRAFKVSDNSDRYIQVKCASNAATTSTRVWFTGRVTD